jgi:uracil-DNA glycosylase
MRESPDDLLAAIAEEIKRCTACPLHQDRAHAVPGEGPVGAPVAFIGEAPGADEDKQGRPFVGRSGQLLRKTIRECGWREDEVFIGNVLKCRPPDNRDPLEPEVAACRHFLYAQLALLQPKVVVTLGRHSMYLLIDPKLKITQVRGQHIRKSGLLFLPTFHPSAVLRDNNLLPDFQRDLRVARALSERDAAAV